MTNYSDYFYYLRKNIENLENDNESQCSEEVFNNEEICPLGEAAYSAIRHGITIYREEIISQHVPDEVHIRLHTIIKRQWSILYDNTDTDVDM